MILADKRGQINYYHNGDYMMFAAAGSEKLRITSGGSVAIGVISPSDKLHVGGNNAFIRVDRPNGNPGLTLIYNSTNSTRADIDVTTGGDLRFATNNSTERLRIDSDGRLLANGATASNAWTGGDDLVIGNTNSGTRTGITLVSHSGSDGGIYWSDGTAANAYRGQLAYNHANDTMSLYTAAAARLRITSGGIVLINDANVSTNRADAPLQIETGANGNALNLRARSGDNIYSYLNFQNNAGSQTAAHIYLQRDASNNAGTLVFGTAAASANTPTERLYITSTGWVGINESSPDQTLHVTGTNGDTVPARFESTGAHCRIGFKSSGSANSYNVACGGEGNNFIIYTNNTEKLRITSVGQLLHTRSDNTTRYDLEFRQTGGISDGNYSGIHWTQGSTGSTNLAAIEIEYADSGRPAIVFKNRQSGGTSMSEAVRIDSGARLGVRDK